MPLLLQENHSKQMNEAILLGFVELSNRYEERPTHVF